MAGIEGADEILRAIDNDDSTALANLLKTNAKLVKESNKVRNSLSNILILF
jgi:hypothetical protein